MDESSLATPRRVLVVDDEPATRELLAEILKAEKWQVHTAGSVNEALAVLQQLEGAIDLLILDIGLPDGDGGELAVRAGEIFGAHPTVFVTGWVDEFVHLSMVPGRWMILRKPFSIQKLLECIEAVEKHPELRNQQSADS